MAKRVAELRREWGENALPEKRKSKLVLLLLAFTTPMALLIWVGALAELTVGLLKQAEGRQGVSGPTEDLVDFGVLLLLQVILSISSCNKTFEFTNKSFEAYTLKDTGKL